MEYTVIRRKNRKYLRIEVKVTGEVIVRSSPYISDEKIKAFVDKNQQWITDIQREYAQKYHCIKTVSKTDREQAKKDVMPCMRQLTEYYADIMGLNYKTVKITNAEKRWGSCSNKNTICYSYRTAYISQKCREYLVIHELSHLKEFNHSKNFYSFVSKYMPDYKQAEKELQGYYIHIE